MAQAIMAFYSQNIWSKKHPRHTQRTLHWVLQVIGSSAAIIGIITEYIGRWQKSKNHFISTHSTIGLIAGICTLITMMSGISALWSTKLKKYARPIYFKLMHNFGGMTVFILGKFYQENPNYYRWYQEEFYFHRNDSTVFRLRKELYDQKNKWIYSKIPTNRCN